MLTVIEFVGISGVCCRLLVNILISHPEFTPLTVNLLATVENRDKDRQVEVVMFLSAF